MWLIVGLGNPGPKYELTRHNIGFLAIDYALTSLGNAPMKSGFNGLFAQGNLEGEKVILLKPQTYMNKSGLSVQAAAAFYKIRPDHIIVLHDDMDLLLGQMRIKQGGGHGGHNGLRDIDAHLGANYVRIRLGIGRPAIKGTESDFVLHPFSNAELKTVEEVIKKSHAASVALMKEDLAAVQQKHQIK